jgi:polysaccharide biosynthesis protein PslG
VLSRRFLVTVVGVLAASLVLLLGLALFVLGPNTLFAWTGEEQPSSQVVALWNLVAGQLRAMPQTAADVPVAHTGMNPFGANTFLEQEVEPAKRELSLQMLHDAGFRWIRQEFPWEDIEIHGKGDFEDRRNEPYRSAWDKYDNIVDLAQKYDLQIIARLSHPPAWTRAAGNARGSYAPPDDLADYGDYVRAVVGRYKGRIRYYQIWNEPNIYPEWGEAPVDPEGYTALLKTGYESVKSVDPDAVVICGALAATIEMDGHPNGMNDFLFLQRMYDAGARSYFDVMAVQGYGLWSAPTDRRMRPRVLNFSRPQYIRDIMVKNGDAQKPIWMTEMNWNAIPLNHPAPPAYGRVTEQQQADYARLAYQRAQAEWPWMGVINVWFFKRASDAEKDQSWYYFRMVEPDFRPLPLYDALKEEAQQPPVMYPGYHQEDDWAVYYLGSWRHVTDSQAVLGGYQESQGNGAAQGGDPGNGVRLTFAGTDLDLVLREKPDGAQIAVACDGEDPVTVNTRGSSPTSIRVAACRRLRDGRHEVNIRVLASSGGPASVGIDGFVVRRTLWGGIDRILGIVAMCAGAAVLATWFTALRQPRSRAAARVEDRFETKR